VSGPADLADAFDVYGPLPVGTTVVEASAGTGKTFALAALATRYVAEGVAPLDTLMVVTFGRAATQELRQRVRRRLVSAERGLADPGRARSGADLLVRFLATAPDADVVLRRRRLTAALATFDAATIATTHGFCQQMLAGLGVAGDRADVPVVTDLDDLVTEVVNDLYVRKFAPPGSRPPAMPYACALSVARAAVADRQARLEPMSGPVSGPTSDAEWAQRWGLATAVRAEVDRRKRQRGLLDFDDMLFRLRDALTDTRTGPAARARLGNRFAVVLVDEFQDTDPVQWDILRLAFAETATLVLIGDPKQAIYGFRGADVVTYLAAAGSARTHQTLSVNWRSDAPLVAGLGELFGGAALGDPRILARPVRAAHDGPRLRSAPGGAPLRLRVVRRDGLPPVRGGTRVGPTRQRVADDLAADVVRLLASPAVLHTEGGDRPLRPGDVAVLVRTHAHGALIRDSLVSAGVPAVLAGTSSVFLTTAAREWLVVLQALEQPHRAGRVRAAALTCFLGWTAEQLADGGEAAMDELGPQMRRWADLLRSRGVAALFEALTVGQELPARLLRGEGGERQLTDLRHIAQTLHASAVAGRLGPTALPQWLRRRMAEASADTTEERSRRLESDAEAVAVVTVHRSKGMEFPVVYLPFGWDRHTPSKPDPLRLHDEADGRVLDVGGADGPGYGGRRARHLAEEAGEDLRLLYVACTRAQCQLVAWWAPGSTASGAALHRLLFGGHRSGESPPPTVPVPTEADAARRLQQLVDRAGGTIAVETAGADAAGRWNPPAPAAAWLQLATFDRRLDTGWRRTSYSALTAAAYDPVSGHADVGSEPEHPERGDEAAPLLSVPQGDRDPAGAEPADEQRLRAVRSPMADLPAGTVFGSAVHAVLETVDPRAGDLHGEVRLRCRAALAGRAGVADPGALADGLLPVLATPLGPLAGDRRLCDIPPGDRLAELAFELPLLGGDAPAGNATLAAVADLLRRELAPSDPLVGYPDLLAGPAVGGERLRGYLTGSLDAVLRVRDDAGEPCYLVVDYKTNWLGEGTPAEPLSAWHYRPAALTAAMLRGHYPLQALLYAVALHRFLRWRQPGYDPARHLGGVLYLFVRGMCGATTPLVDGSPCGVFGWAPSATLVGALSHLLDVGAAESGHR